MKLAELPPFPIHAEWLQHPGASNVGVRTIPYDINDLGHAVGASIGHYTGEPGEPYVRAMLWVDGEPVAPLRTDNASEAMRINNRDEVLIAEMAPGSASGASRFHLLRRATGETIDVATLIQGLTYTYDLDDHGRLLALRQIGEEFLFEVLIHDVDSGAQVVLPPFRPGWTIRWIDQYGWLGIAGSDGQARYCKPIGLDNAGRVCAVIELSENQFEVVWLPAGGPEWLKTAIPTCVGARFSKSGLVLPSIATGDSNVDAFWYDLAAASPALQPIVLATAPGSYWGDPRDRGPVDANEAGLIAVWDGVAGITGGFASVHDTHTGVTTSLQPNFSLRGLKVFQARAINNLGHVACVAYRQGPPYPAGADRGYIAAPDPLSRRMPDWVVRILIGVVQDGGGMVWPPGGPPIPVGPLAWDALAPAQQDILIHTAISRLLSGVHDPDMRRRIERLNAEAIRLAAERLANG